MRYWLILPVLIALLIPIYPVSAYEITYYARNNSVSSNTNVTAPSVFWSGDCSVDFRIRASANDTTPFYLTHHYYSPALNQIQSQSVYNPYSVTCQLQTPDGYSTGTNDKSNWYESAVMTEYQSDRIQTWIETIYDCEPDSNDYFIYSNVTATDTYGNHPYAYGKRINQCFEAAPASCSIPLTGDLGTVIDYLQDGYRSDCGQTLRIDAPGETYEQNSGGTASDMYVNYWTMIPFHSSSGLVNISIMNTQFVYTGTGSCSNVQETFQYYLWNTVTNNTYSLGTANPVNLEVTVSPNDEYFLLIGTQHGCENRDFGQLIDTYDYSNYNITVYAYEPEWECTGYGECYGGIKTNTCTDPLNKVPDWVTTVACDSTVLENATLGFEESENVEITICTPQYQVNELFFGLFTGYSCLYLPANYTMQRPLNWSIVGDSTQHNRHFMQFTGSWHTEGSKSLMLWQIPPKRGEPYGASPQTTCTNSTDTYYPELNTSFNNNTMDLAYSVTFPAENMRLSIDLKTCPGQVEHHSEYSIFNGTFIERTLCPELCYANTCEGVPGSSVAIIDLQDNNSVSLFGGSITLDITGQPTTVTKQFDLSGLGIEPGVYYNLMLDVYNGKPLDQGGNCIMIDNIRYDVIDTPFLSVLGGVCASKCVGYDWYDAHLLPSGTCAVSKIEYSPDCVDSSIQGLIENLEDACIGSHTLLIYNDITGKHTPVSCEFGCYNNACQTEDGIDTDVQLGDIGEIFYEIPVLASILILVLTILLPIKYGNYGGHGTAGGMLLFGILQLVFVFSIYGLLPLYFAIGESLLGALVIAVYFNRWSKGW